MQFMVIEKFRNQDAKSVYRRFRDKGRMVPDGITFVNSWVSADLDRCFQIMECSDVTLLQRWVTSWSDLVEFEVIPVSPGKDVAAALQSQCKLEVGLVPGTGGVFKVMVGDKTVAQRVKGQFPSSEEIVAAVTAEMQQAAVK